MPDTRYSITTKRLRVRVLLHYETTSLPPSLPPSLTHSLTQSLTYLWTSWFLLNWRMTWCGLFVLVGTSNNKSLVGVLWSFCPWTLLLLWTVHSVLLPARLNEKWDERSLFRVFHTFPTRTCRDSIIWFRFASYRFRIPTDVDHLRRRGRRRCVYGIYGTGSGPHVVLIKTLFTSLNSRDRRKCFQYSCRPYSQLPVRYVGTMKSIVPMIRDLSLPYNPCWYY